MYIVEPLQSLSSFNVESSDARAGFQFPMATVEIKYDCTPHDGTPGKAWDDFEERLLDVAAGKTDDRGYSLADALNGTDEGSPGGPAYPPGACSWWQGQICTTRTPQGFLQPACSTRVGRKLQSFCSTVRTGRRVLRGGDGTGLEVLEQVVMVDQHSQVQLQDHQY